MNTSMRRKLTALAVIPAVLALAGVTAAQAADPLDSPAVKALYAKAKKEGEVIIWGPQKRTLSWVVDAFGKRFPGIKVTTAASLRSTTKIITEAKAGKHSVDVFHWPISSGMLPLNKRGLLGDTPFDIFGAPKNKIWLGGKVAGTHNLAYTIAYNYKLVKEADLPNKWEDLLHPRWKNKIVGSSFLTPWLFAYLALDWGQERTLKFARALINTQNVMFTRAPREGILKSGERVMVIGEFPSSVRAYQDHGVPVKWKFMEATPSPQFTVATLKDAPHPNAAKLLAGYMTTQEARDISNKVSYQADLHPASQHALAKEMRASGTKQILENPSNFKARLANHKIFRPIVTGRKK